MYSPSDTTTRAGDGGLSGAGRHRGANPPWSGDRGGVWIRGAAAHAESRNDGASTSAKGVKSITAVAMCTAGAAPQ